MKYLSVFILQWLQVEPDQVFLARGVTAKGSQCDGVWRGEGREGRGLLSTFPSGGFVRISEWKEVIYSRDDYVYVSIAYQQVVWIL